MVGGRSIRWELEATRLPTGFIGIKAVIQLHVRSSVGRFPPIGFQVDSAANVTSISVTRAWEFGITVPQKTVEANVRTSAGTFRQRVHPGRITVRVPGLPGRDFYWPCHFVEHAGAAPVALLGLSGVLDDQRIILDGTYSEDAPYGWLILEEASR